MDKTIFTGKFGGKYWIDDKGRKRYVKREKSMKKLIEKEFNFIVNRYYQGDLEMSFTETIQATSYENALAHITDLYRSHGSYDYTCGILK